MTWAYDLEVFYNYFLAKFKNIKTGEKRMFRIYKEDSEYDRNDVVALADFARDRGKYLMGFNSYEYDDQLLNYIIKTKTIGSFPVDKLNATLYQISKQIIDNDYRAHKYDKFFKRIDLKRVGALEKSLKYCAMNLKMNIIQDLPHNPHSKITENQIPGVESYCDIDVDIVIKMFTSMRNELVTRLFVENQFGVPAINESNSGIANKLFTKMYSDATNTPIKEFSSLRSKIDRVKIGDIILPNVQFDDPIIKEYIDMISKRYIETNVDKITVNLPILNYKNIKYKFGAGGLHSVDKGAIYETDDNYLILDADVSSYYPAIMLEYMLYPEHLCDIFIELLRDIRDKRLVFKKDGDTISSYIYKIIINSIFGKMGDQRSFLYSPKRMLQTTINGQLFLIMLAEKLESGGFKVISVNTDGITAKVHRSKLAEYYRICKQWEVDTRFNLEYVNYIKYVRLNVNNYIATYMKDGKLAVKRKGKILHRYLYKELTKSYYMPIVAAAIEEYFIHGVKPSTYIRNSIEGMDFYIGSKIGKQFDTMYVTGDNTEELQHTLRFYISNSGGRLIKTKTKGYSESKQLSMFDENDENDNTAIAAGFNVRLGLNHDPNKPIDQYDINYNYYIGEAMKWIKKIEKENKMERSKFRNKYQQGTLF